MIRINLRVRHPVLEGILGIRECRERKFCANSREATLERERERGANLDVPLENRVMSLSFLFFSPFLGSQNVASVVYIVTKY